MADRFEDIRRFIEDCTYAGDCDEAEDSVLSGEFLYSPFGTKVSPYEYLDTLLRRFREEGLCSLESIRLAGFERELMEAVDNYVIRNMYTQKKVAFVLDFLAERGDRRGRIALLRDAWFKIMLPRERKPGIPFDCIMEGCPDSLASTLNVAVYNNLIDIVRRESRYDCGQLPEDYCLRSGANDTASEYEVADYVRRLAEHFSDRPGMFVAYANYLSNGRRCRCGDICMQLKATGEVSTCAWALRMLCEFLGVNMPRCRFSSFEALAELKTMEWDEAVGIISDWCGEAKKEVLRSELVRGLARD